MDVCMYGVCEKLMMYNVAGTNAPSNEMKGKENTTFGHGPTQPLLCLFFFSELCLMII